MTRDEATAILDEARANQARLLGCAGPHTFERLDDRPIGGRWRCTRCQGTVGNMDHAWYLRGLQHGLARG